MSVSFWREPGSEIMATDEPDEPEKDRRQEEIDKALAAIHELRKRTGRITLGELLSARDEGRKS
jgi:hypothetical protein